MDGAKVRLCNDEVNKRACMVCLLRLWHMLEERLVSAGPALTALLAKLSHGLSSRHAQRHASPKCMQVCSGAAVAAGALVSPGTVVPTGEIWAGSPAKFLRKLEESEAAFIR